MRTQQGGEGGSAKSVLMRAWVRGGVWGHECARKEPWYALIMWCETRNGSLEFDCTFHSPFLQRNFIAKLQWNTYSIRRTCTSNWKTLFRGAFSTLQSSVLMSSRSEYITLMKKTQFWLVIDMFENSSLYIHSFDFFIFSKKVPRKKNVEEFYLITTITTKMEKYTFLVETFQ